MCERGSSVRDTTQEGRIYCDRYECSFSRSQDKAGVEKWGGGKRGQLSPPPPPPTFTSGGAVPPHFFQCPIAKVKQLL